MTDGVIKEFEIVRSRDVILDIISSNIVDPLTGEEARKATTHWIFDGFPNPADIGKPAPAGWKFPIIIFDYPEIETENKVVDGSKQEIRDLFRIKTNARTRRAANVLADEIKHILETTGQSQLRTGTLHGPNIISSTDDVDFIGGNKYYIKVLEFEFMRFD